MDGATFYATLVKLNKKRQTYWKVRTQSHGSTVMKLW